MRTSRAVVLLLLLGVIGTACGARLDAQTRRQAADAVLNGGSGAGTGTGVGTGTGTGLGSGSTGGPGGGGAIGGGGTATGPGGGTQTGPGGGSAPTGTGPGTQTGGSAGTAGGTDVGLTSNSVLLGTVASTTGPVAGLFEGAAQGIQAFRAFANSQGGICGHAVNVKFADDGTNCNQNRNATEDLAKSVFAFVGSFSLYDGCGAEYLKQNTDIPDLHVQLDPAAGQIPNHFDVEPGPLGYATGPFAYYAKKYPLAVKHVGTLYPNIPSAAQKQKGFVHAAESEGWNFAYSRAADATETDWTSDFVKMCKDKGVRLFFTSAENAQNAAKMIQNEDQAGCPSSLINIIPIAYDQAFVGDVGDTKKIEGLQGWNEYSLFFNKDEAANIPELRQLQAWFARTNPGKPLNLYALFAWAEGRMFQQAFENAGKTVNRKALLGALAKINKFSANGIVAPVNPGSKTEGPSCYVLWIFSNGAFHRQSTPAANYRCDGRFLPLNG